MDNRIGGKKTSKPTRVMHSRRDNNQGAEPTAKVGGENPQRVKTKKIDIANSEAIKDADAQKSGVSTEKIDTESPSLTDNKSAQDDGFRRVKGSTENIQVQKVNEDSDVESGAAPKPAFAEKKPVKTRKFPIKNATSSSENRTPAFVEAEEVSENESVTDSPVVGWLVVISGPGQGTSIEFSFGKNSIGRDSDQTIPLDYGDANISRQEHAYIEYDPRERKCYLIKGSNLVYLNGSRIASGSESELFMGDVIELGNTQLVFMPFCGESFCWTESM